VVTSATIGKYLGCKPKYRFSPVSKNYRVVIERKELTVAVS